MRPGFERIISHEAHLGIDHWNNLDAKHKQWSEYNSYSDSIHTRETSVKKLVKLIKSEVLPNLTGRQRQIMRLYFESQLKEVEIARILGISQPTVSQHLFGKKRNGKKVGGSIQKIRKFILKKSSNTDYESRSDSLVALQKFLGDRIDLLNELSFFEDSEC